MEELNRKIPQLPWIVAAIGIIIAGYFFLSTSKVNTELNDRQCELDAYNLRLEQYKKLETVYGHGSERYYAKQPILILRPEGAEGKITIFWDNSNLTLPEGTRATATKKHSDKIEAKWEDKFDIKTHLSNVIVKPRNKTGCYPITFTDNVSDDKFQVLVVVK